jgi:hypothetical protein
VNDIRAVYWGGDERLATALAEYADRAGPWPGIPPLEPFPITIILTRSEARFDSLTRRRLPGWAGAVAFPRANTIVLRIDGDPIPILRHELAHLMLARVAPRVPLWFAEGYAARAAGEWGGLDALTVNWELARGRVPTFPQLDRELRADPASARAAYALAMTAVLDLERLGGSRGLGPLISHLADAPDFETAVRQTYLASLETVEADWRHDLRRRYGWLLLVTSFTMFWSLVGLVVGVVWWRRRRDNRRRRAALDEGWTIPADPDGAA